MTKTSEIKVSREDGEVVVALTGRTSLNRTMFLDPLDEGLLVSISDGDNMPKGQMVLNAADIHNLSRIVQELESLGVIQ